MVLRRLAEWQKGRVAVVAMDIAGSGPALPAEPRPVHESAPLPSDYPAWGGVPQCLAAATEPVQIVPSAWEVQAGLPMEAFWCTSGPPQVTQYNFTPAKQGKGKAKTRKKAALAAVKQIHRSHGTAADTLALTDAGSPCPWAAERLHHVAFSQQEVQDIAISGGPGVRRPATKFQAIANKRVGRGRPCSGLGGGEGSIFTPNLPCCGVCGHELRIGDVRAGPPTEVVHCKAHAHGAKLFPQLLQCGAALHGPRSVAQELPWAWHVGLHGAAERPRVVPPVVPRPHLQHCELVFTVAGVSIALIRF